MNTDEHRLMASEFPVSNLKFRPCRRWISTIGHAVLCALAVTLSATAQGPGTGGGIAETLEAIERARVTTRILYVTAHPDDESSSILTYLARGLHADVALLSLTRGEGGQNALGPEMAPQLGVIRTEELLRATQQYGARLYFTRAADFGYSKTPEETLRTWGDAVVQDMVAVLLHFRPHIIINNWGGVTTGHGHHQAAGLLVPRALQAVTQRDPDWPWQETQVYDLWRGRFGETGRSENRIELPTDEISPLWGRTYNEIGLEGFVSHRTQGIVGFRSSRFFRGRRTLIPVSGSREQWQIQSLSTRNSNPFPEEWAAEAEAALAQARTAAEQQKWAECTRWLAKASLALRTQLADSLVDVSGKRVIFPQEKNHREFSARIRRALALAAGLRLEAEADRGELVAGERFTVRVSWQQRAGVPLKLGEAELLLPDGWQLVEKAAEGEREVRFTVEIPTEAKREPAENDWMHPWPTPLVRARIAATVEGYTFAVEEAVTAQRVTSTRVDTLPLTLVPAVTLTPEPRQFVVAQGQPPKALELLARVHHYGRAAADVEVALQAPAGWQASAPLKLKFDGAGDQLVKFTVTPPRNPPAGSYKLEPVARIAAPGAEFRTSLEPLPTLPTRLWSEPAVANVRVFDVNVPRGLRVGYVAAENDPIPAALRQLGIEVTMLDEVTLAFGDLQRFDAIAIGIRAYELRSDLSRVNRRLLDYCAAGGTLVVQYQRDGIWNRLNPAPYPAGMPDDTPRVSLEDAPVRLLEPAHALLNLPNRITARDFDGWVQERGLYFWGQFDARYTPLLGMNDPGEKETTGSLVVAQHGRGTYVYTGLSFFRQLPEGVPGAYRLFVNLLSQSKKP
jgi:LmbE family N-acetylglucosaminyl deacetylase